MFKLKKFENPIVNLTVLCQLCAKIVCFFFVWVDVYIYLCGEENVTYKRAIHLVRPHFFRKLRHSSKPTNKNLTQIGLEIQTAISQQPFTIRQMIIWNFFLTMAETITSKNNDLFFWITLYYSEPKSMITVKIDYYHYGGYGYHFSALPKHCHLYTN